MVAFSQQQTALQSSQHQLFFLKILSAYFELWNVVVGVPAKMEQRELTSQLCPIQTLRVVKMFELDKSYNYRDLNHRGFSFEDL